MHEKNNCEESRGKNPVAVVKKGDGIISVYKNKDSLAEGLCGIVEEKR